MAKILISAVVELLAGIAGNLIVEEVSRLSNLQENILWVKEEMSCIQSFLEDVDAVESESNGLTDFIRSICDVAYDLEDIIEEYFPKLSPLARTDWKRYLGWLSCAKTAHDFVGKIAEIRRRVEQIKGRRQTFQVHEATGHARKQEWDPRKTFPHVDEVHDVVGMDEHIKELVAKVTDHSQYRVISITGMPGVGKTTLAKKVYNSVRQSFNCSAWIYVSRQPNPNELLRAIASQVGLTKELIEQNVEHNLFLFLRLKKYIIVIDDIWQIEPWTALKNGIPINSMNGSRIIITSRGKDVCVQIGGQDFLHELQPLDERNSRDLFFKLIPAAPQDNDEDGDPSRLEEIGEKILKRCGGVPLAIVVMAGLLLSREKSIHAWEGALESIGTDKDQCSKIFALSYKDLPSELKPCFLYFGLFSEDHEISTFKLINLWAAEGFIHGNKVRTVEDKGQDCLNQLVGRNLIQVVERRFNRTVRLCRIHDTLHELCIWIAREINFLNKLNDAGANGLAPRRVTAYEGVADNYVFRNQETRKLRALLWNTDGPQVKFRHRNFKYLRMLTIMGFHHQLPPINEIVKTKHLHHLELGNFTVTLPYAISNLKNLLTLDLHQCIEVFLPDVIWKMEQLRHILLPFSDSTSQNRGFNLDSHKFHRFEFSLPNLQTLYGLDGKLFEASCLHKLKSLRRLKVQDASQRIIEVLSSANSLSERLEELHIVSPCNPRQLSTEFESTLDLSKYVELGKLVMAMTGVVDLPQYDKLPKCLKELILWRTTLKMVTMETLEKLPRLETLIVGDCSYEREEFVWSVEAGSFPQLKVLKIDVSFLKGFAAVEGAMPKLENLTLSHRISDMSSIPNRIRSKIMFSPVIIEGAWKAYP